MPSLLQQRAESQVIEINGALGRLGFTHLPLKYSIDPFRGVVRLVELTNGHGSVKTYLVIGSTRLKDKPWPENFRVYRDVKGSLAAISAKLFGERLFRRR